MCLMLSGPAESGVRTPVPAIRGNVCRECRPQLLGEKFFPKLSIYFRKEVFLFQNNVISKPYLGLSPVGSGEKTIRTRIWCPPGFLTQFAFGRKKYYLCNRKRGRLLQSAPFPVFRALFPPGTVPMIVFRSRYVGKTTCHVAFPVPACRRSYKPCTSRRL